MRRRLDPRELTLFVATCAYSGRAPAPASVASLLTVFVMVLLRDSWLLGPGFPLLLVAALGVGFYVAGRAERALGEKDAVSIVIDDACGMLVAAWGFQRAGVDVLLVLWLVFRVIDNVKVFPIGIIERRLKGSAGVMLDDVVAGIYTNVAYRLAVTAWVALRA